MGERVTIANWLFQAAERWPDRGISTVGAGRLTFLELLQSAERIAGGLCEDGVAPNDPVVLLTQRPEIFFPAFWGVILAGGTAVPMPDDASPAEAKRVRGVLKLLNDPYIIRNELPDGSPVRNMSSAPPLVQFSSGTTRDPAGIVLEHRHLLVNVQQMQDRLPIRSPDHKLTWMPHYHDMGLIGCHLLPLSLGVEQTRMRPDQAMRDPLDWLRVAADIGATLLSTTNFGLARATRRLMNESVDLSRVRHIFNGAEPINPEVCRAFCHVSKLPESVHVPLYGLAEASVGVCGPSEGGLQTVVVDERERVIIGPVLDQLEYRIVDGEFQIRGPNVYERLWGQDAHGLEWIQTGDLVKETPQGIAIIGRQKDLIVVNGRNLHADDIELFCEQVTGVRFAVATAEEREGCEALRIQVVLGPDVEPPPVLWELADRVRGELGVDVRCEPIATVLRTTSGKKKRHANHPPNMATLELLGSLYQQATGREPEPDVALRSLGMSSLQAVELLARLEQRWGRTLDHSLMREASLQTLAHRLEAGSPPRAATLPDRQSRVAVLAAACRLPGARTPEEFWNGAASGTRIAKEPFDANTFRLSEAQAAVLDPQLQLSLTMAQELLGDGHPRRIGVFVGAGQQSFQNALISRLDESLPAETMAGNLLSGLATSISHHFNLSGPAFTIDTACSSSLVALHLACRSLRDGECEQALVAGINLNLDGPVERLFQLAGALSPRRQCTPFQPEADGTVPADGAVMILVAPGEGGLATIRSTAINNDGASLGWMAPNPAGQEEVLRLALAAAGISASQVASVEAHGSGTQVGDTVEDLILTRLYPHARRSMAKERVGHGLAAAGLTGFLHAVGQVQPGEIGAVSSFGFGGTNAHAIIEKPLSSEIQPSDAIVVKQPDVSGEGWVHRVRPDPAGGLSWSPVPQGKNMLRQGGRYVVTGSSGGIGGRLIRWLKDRFNAEVIGFSRRDGVDLSDAIATGNQLQKIGPVDGVFHLAGSVDQPDIKRQAVEHLSDIDAGFHVLFSSISAILPGLDQGIEEYAAANAWLDRWAARRDDALSIAWPPWEGAGMADGHGDAYRARGIPTISAAQGFAAMEWALGSGESHVVVLPRPRISQKPLPKNFRSTLLGLLAEVGELAIEDIDENAQLVELGIDSLLALELVERLESILGRELPSTLLYEFPTVSLLLEGLSGSAMLERRQKIETPQTPKSNLREDRCLPAQETFLAQRAFFPDIPGNVLIGCTLSPRVAEADLRAGLDALAQRHPALSLAFQRTKEGWVERPGVPPEMRFGLFEFDEVHGETFDLEHGPVMRVFCDGEHLILNGHHAAVDAWSLQQSLQDLLFLIQGSSLPQLRTDWKTARQALAESQEEDAGFWTDKLSGCPRLQLPWCAEPDAPTAPPVRALQRRMDPETTAALVRRAKAAGVTLPVFVLSAYIRLLWDKTGQHDVVVRVAQGRRELRLPDVRRVVGSFADSLPIRVAVELNDSVDSLAPRVATELSEVMAHAASSARGLANLGSRSFGGPTGLSPAGFSFPMVPAPSQYGSIEVSDIVGAAANGFTRLGLVCWLFDGALHMSWNYPESHLTSTVMEAFSSGLEKQLIHPEPVQPRTIHGAVLERCRQHPSRPAIEHLTYGDIDALSGGLAARLSGARVAVFASPSPDAVVLLMGVLRSGAAYVPLDPFWPDARIKQILDASEPTHLVTTEDLAGRAGTLHHSVMRLNGDRVQDGINQDAETAYVMFTSGSTGTPKGVVVTHREQLGFQTWVKRQFGITSKDRFIQTSSLGFGGSLRQIFTPLLNGGSIHPVHRNMARDPDTLLDFIAAQGITIYNSVPSMWAHLMGAMERRKAIPDSLRWCLVGGEALPAAMVRRWRKLVGHRIRMMNLYGSTETLVNATAFEVIRDLPDDAVHTPIGWTRAGQVVELVDVQAGIGEIVVGGNIASGYLDEDQTREAFDNHPTLGRVYRTGDLAKRGQDGALIYLGRKDSQVQVHGNRVELGEIEHTLYEAPGVRSAIVLLVDGRLEATVEGDGLDDQWLRDFVKARLPHYMVPHRVHLGSVPRNAAGKADRRLVPKEPEPAGDDAEELLRLVCQVLALDQVNLEDHFFRLGGDSVQVLELLDAVHHRFGRAPSPMNVYRDPTIRGLLTWLKKDAPSVETVQHKTGLSAVQRGFWLAHRADPKNAPAWRTILPLEGPLDLRRFTKAVDTLIQRHEMLRTSFTDEPAPLLLQDPGSAWMQIDDLSRLPDPKSMLEDRFREEAAALLNMNEWPLVRMRLCRMGPEEYQLIVNAHHIVADAWSAWLMMGELLLLHDGNRLDAAPQFVPPAESSHDPWWGDYLRGLHQPVGQAVPARESEIHLEPWALEGLKARARQAGTTPFVLVLSVFFEALAEVKQVDDIAISVAHAARPPDAAAVVGPFARALPVRSRPTLDAVIDAWKQVLAHGDAPPSSFLAAGDPERLGRYFLTWMDPAQVPTPDTKVRCAWERARYAFATQSTNTEALVGCLVKDGLHLNLHGGPLLDMLKPVLERRLIEAAHADGVLVVYAPDGMQIPATEPIVIERVETSKASAELVLIPKSLSEINHVEESVRRALAVSGAPRAALGGMLPIRTGLAVRPMGEAELTTGHAMTVVAMAWTVEAVLTRMGWSWKELRVGHLGWGAIGRAVHAFLKSRLGEPGEWLIQDPAHNRADPIEKAKMILGASSGGATLDVASLEPGTVVIDDSFPRCFDDKAAIGRMESSRDVILVHGGAVDAGRLNRTSPFPQASAIRAQFGAHWLPGCLAELLLWSSYPELGPTRGAVTSTRAEQVAQFAKKAGWRAAPFHLGPFVVPEDLWP
jgi:amino acid adenylation domain-containing protein